MLDRLEGRGSSALTRFGHGGSPTIRIIGPPQRYEDFQRQVVNCRERRESLREAARSPLIVDAVDGIYNLFAGWARYLLAQAQESEGERMPSLEGRFDMRTGVKDRLLLAARPKGMDQAEWTRQCWEWGAEKMVEKGIALLEGLDVEDGEAVRTVRTDKAA